jgi:hypothetical protein
MRYRNYLCRASEGGDDFYIGVATEHYDHPLSIQALNHFESWIHDDWQSVEVPQRDEI